jgi:DNA-binding NarL/FixJ family response regulator
MDELRVLVITDDPLARAGLVTLLSQSDCNVVGQVAGNADLVAELPLYRPDLGKLEAQSRTEAVVRATRLGLLLL